MRSVISDAHVAGNDEISCDSVAISALRAAALRRLRSETRLRAQSGRRNSLQEGLFHKIKGSPVGLSFLFVTNSFKAQETVPLSEGEKRRKKGRFCLFT